MSIRYDHKIIFDPITVGTEEVKYFVIKNEPRCNQLVVEQYPNLDLSYKSFTVRKNINNIVKDELILIIKYHPFQPDEIHINYYLIKIPNKVNQVLCVRGKSDALKLGMTVRSLNFYRLLESKKTSAVFELKNGSTCNATYLFDIDNSQKIFEVIPVFGEIPPRKIVYVTVKFLIKKPGIFFIDLPCLFLCHQPIYLELVGINAPNENKICLKELNQQLLKIRLQNGFEKYMTEYFGLVNLKPACRFTKKFLECSAAESTKYTEIYNLTNSCIKLIWDAESDENFDVKLSLDSIRPDDRTIVEINFKPSTLERLYGSRIYGRLLIFKDSDECEKKNVYISINLQLTGNAFSQMRTWIGTLNVFPNTVTLPVCTSTETVYGTFILSRCNNFPVIYKFIRPIQSRFCVKPETGILFNPYQICIVKFTGNNEMNTIIEEKWKIELNQVEDNYTEVVFSVGIQNLNVVVGTKNKIKFANTFPGCKDNITVPIVNHSIITIKFRFTNNKWFSVEPLEGIIEGHESLELNWCFTADCDVQNETRIAYEIWPISSRHIILNSPTIFTFEAQAKCSHGRLCSTPFCHDFGAISCGDLHETSFHLFNFSEATLNFSLIVRELYGGTKEQPLPVTVSPVQGTLMSRNHINVSVKLLTYWSSLSTYSISYSLRGSEKDEQNIDFVGISFATQGVIFRVDYFSFYPTLKFIEVNKITTGPLFGKLDIWSYFNMKRLNEIIRTIRANQTHRHYVRVPDSEAALSIQKTIVFILRNVTTIDTTCCMVRKKICDCKPKAVVPEKGVSTIRSYTYKDCPHRKIIAISTESDVVKAYSTMFISIDIRYELLGLQEVCYLMKLSHNRTIELYFNVNGLSLGELSTYSSGFTFNFYNIFIGEFSPDIQYYSFFNNTRSPADYSLDLTQLAEYNEKIQYEVLQCLNPEGIVRAKSCHTIFFKFSPISVGRVHFELPFNFGGKSRFLTIKGRSLLHYISPLDELYFTEIGKDYLESSGLMINISTEHIIIRSLPTFCSTTRLFTLRNITPGRCIGFTFNSLYKENIATAYVNPESGILQPNELCTLVLRLESWSNACALQDTITCHLIDQTSLKEHVDSNTAYFHKADTLQDHFLIGEDGVKIYPQARSLTITPAPRIFHRIISISVHIISLCDLDLKLTIQDQLKQTPFYDVPLEETEEMIKALMISREKRAPIDKPLSTLYIDQLAPRPRAEKKLKKKQKRSRTEGCFYNCCLIFSTEEFVNVNTVLSCLVRDIVYSKKFKHWGRLLQQSSEKYYYSLDTDQLTIKIEREMIELLVNQVPKWFISEVISTMLADCVMQTFNLGNYPFDFTDSGKAVNTQSGATMYTDKFLFLFDSL